MFTGLIEGQGTVHAIEADGPAITLVIAIPPELDEATAEDQNRIAAHIGDSIAINGCCLTVVKIETGSSGEPLWSFQAGEETLSKTNLGALQVGHKVNLERSLSAAGRLGGHFVQGHVDAVGIVDQIDNDGEWTNMWFRIPKSLAKQLVSKGSIAIDGISLTVVNIETVKNVDEERFSVALIPHTLEVTTLGTRKTGDTVNLETDILGKYVQRFLTHDE